MRTNRVLILAAVVAAVLCSAQASAPPVLDELAQEYINGVALASQTEQFALDVLKQTEAYKKYDAAKKTREQLQADRLARIEKKYPGYTVDWARRLLVPKPPQAARKE
jgi:hypothetical protein